MAEQFVAFIDHRSGDPVLINMRHVNCIRPDGRGTRIHMNNPGASGVKVTDSFDVVRSKLEERN